MLFEPSTILMAWLTNPAMLFWEMMLFEQWMKREMPSLPVKFWSRSGQCVRDGAGPEIWFFAIMLESALSIIIGSKISILLSDIMFEAPSSLMP